MLRDSIKGEEEVTKPNKKNNFEYVLNSTDGPGSPGAILEHLKTIMIHSTNTIRTYLTLVICPKV